MESETVTIDGESWIKVTPVSSEEFEMLNRAFGKDAPYFLWKPYAIGDYEGRGK